LAIETNPKTQTMSKDNIEQKQHLIDLMNMEKQTAVEWLISKIEVNSNPSLTQKEMIGYIEQAKEMEKQEIIDSYASGYIDGVAQNKITAEQYYNETYKKE